jgi:hypothetical protein
MVKPNAPPHENLAATMEHRGASQGRHRQDHRIAQVFCAVRESRPVTGCGPMVRHLE